MLIEWRREHWPEYGIEGCLLDNAVEPVSTPENLPKPGDDGTESSG